MKTIFRFVNIGLLLAAVIAAGSVAGLAQDPCADAEGKTALDAKIRDLLTKKSVPDRKLAVDAGKQFLEKYGACADVKEFADYLKTNIPVMEQTIAKMQKNEEFQKLLVRFDAGMKAKNWDEVYAAGKQILTQAPNPDDFRAIELVLGSIGLDETAKTPRVTKWNDDTLVYAKQSITDLEANKPFKTYGLFIKDGASFVYKNKDDALGWMNYTIGYIYFFDKNDKKQGLSYLYKASQLNSDTKANPVVFQSIGGYYFDDVRKLAKEVQDLIAAQSKDDTPEVAKQKVDAIKAKVAMVNGTAEAAIDAYARAYNLAKKDTKTPKAYTDGLYKTLQDLYNVRFGKPDGFDAWIANVESKPMPNPLMPVTPISDPEPVEPATTTTTTNTTTPAKAPAATPAKPAASPATKPAAGAKPQTSLKKAVAKKKKKV